MTGAAFAVVSALLFSLVTPAGQRQQQTQEDPRATAAISGRVLSAKSGGPIRDATLRLVSFDVMRLARSVRTDEDGRFAFTGLVPGRYQLQARADGHLTLDFGQRRPDEPERPIDLTDEETFDGADFELPGTSAISGVVLDEFSDPAPNVAVMLSTAAYVAGRRRLMPEGQPAVTDDKGQFRIDDLGPGTYYLMGVTGAFASAGESGGFSPTFFPGTLDAEDARPIAVDVAAEVTDLTFAMTPGVTSDLGGRVVDETGAAVPTGTVILVPSDRSQAAVLMIARTAFGPEGTFLFRNVPPGELTIQAFGRPVGGGNLGRAPFGFLTVTMDGTPKADVTVVVPPGRAARGRILFDPADAPRLEPDQVRISLRSTGFDSSPVAGGPPQQTVHEDWTFEVLNMNGLRVLRTDNTSSTWRLKQVLLNGRDVTDTPLDFRTDDVNGLEVVLTNRLGSLSGTVTDLEGRPTRDYTVVIFSSEARHWSFPSRYLHLARANQTGGFQAPGLPPAEYLAVALPTVPEMEWQNPEFLASLRPLATVVNVAEGADASLTLELVRRD